MSRGEPLKFRKIPSTTGAEVYLLNPWPKTALIPCKPTADMAPDTVMVNGNVITVAVKNGFASYGRQRTVNGNYLAIAGESEFLPVPPHVR